MLDSLRTKPRRQQQKQHKYDQKGAWKQGRMTPKNSEQGKHLLICYQALSNHPAWHDPPEGKKHQLVSRAVSLQVPLASLKGLYGIPVFGFTEHPFFSEQGEKGKNQQYFLYNQRGAPIVAVFTNLTSYLSQTPNLKRVPLLKQNTFHNREHR